MDSCAGSSPADSAAIRSAHGSERSRIRDRIGGRTHRVTWVVSDRLVWGFGIMVKRIPLLVAVGVVRLYQGAVRPFLAGSCRFHPTCSEYAIEALTTHGAVRGGILTIKRLLRCRPFSSGGFDPVPPGRSSVRAGCAKPAHLPTERVR